MGILGDHGRPQTCFAYLKHILALLHTSSYLMRAESLFSGLSSGGPAEKLSASLKDSTAVTRDRLLCSALLHFKFD